MTSSKNTPITSKTSHIYPENVDAHLGKIEGVEPDYLYGRALLTDAGDPQRSIWSMADDDRAVRLDRKVFPTVSGNFYIASSDAGDTSVQFSVSSLDATGNRVFFNATTDAADGRTPVLIGTGIDINFVFMNGDNQVNLGDVYFTNDANFTLGIPDVVTSVLAHVPISYGCSPQAIVRVPKGKTMVIKKINLTLSRSGGNSGSAIIHARIRRGATGSFVVAREWHWQTGMAPPLDANGMAFIEESIVEFTVFDVSSADTNLGVECHFEYVDD